MVAQMHTPYEKLEGTVRLNVRFELTEPTIFLNFLGLGASANFETNITIFSADQQFKHNIESLQRCSVKQVFHINPNTNIRPG